MSWLVGAAVTALVLAAGGPAGRPARRVARGAPGDGAAERRVRGLGAPWGARAAAERRDLAAIVTDVAARLRAGAEPEAAWDGALGGRVPPGGPGVLDLVAPGDDRSQAAVVVVAGRLAAELGAPLAPLLDGVARQLVAQAEAESERRAALAGPRATARVLTSLPALGVLLGTAVGADPVAVLLDGGIGSAALVVGLALLLAGRAWTGRLARSAASAGRAT